MVSKPWTNQKGWTLIAILKIGKILQTQFMKGKIFYFLRYVFSFFEHKMRPKLRINRFPTIPCIFGLFSPVFAVTTTKFWVFFIALLTASIILAKNKGQEILKLKVWLHSIMFLSILRSEDSNFCMCWYRLGILSVY